MLTETKHIPVMVDEIVKALKIRDDGIYVDATLGMGGYSRAILNSSSCRLVAIDRDPDSILNSNKLSKIYGERFKAVEGLFSNLDKILNDLEIDKIDGITFDFGVSSPQIDNSERGFSFKNDGPLDMRMSKSGLSASEFLNNTDQNILIDVLKNFGEERKAYKISSAIISARPLKTTLDFAKVIYSVLGNPKKGETDPATRSFQAIRIAINNELEEIQNGLFACLKFLKPGSRIVAVSFHSLEDRIVKNFFYQNSDLRSNQNRHLPYKNTTPKPLKSVTKKPIVPSIEEIFNNPRSRSAKLRISEKRTSLEYMSEKNLQRFC